ncbi:MAG: hypothetical protein ACKV0T_21000 [Planctomycetales bacterium]
MNTAMISALLLVQSWTVEDLDLLYRQNAAQAPTLRVDWRRTVSVTPARIEFENRAVGLLERHLEEGKTPLSEIETVRKRVDEARRSPSELPPSRTVMQDYWSDRDRFQWRYPYDPQTGHEQIERAFIDARRGGIPIRIETFASGGGDLDSVLAAGTKPHTGDAFPYPSGLVRDVEIEEVIPGFFYPMHGYEDDLGRNPDADNVGNKKGEKRVVVYGTTEWEAYRVELNRPMSAAMFDMRFPKHTKIYDKTAK